VNYKKNSGDCCFVTDKEANELSSLKMQVEISVYAHIYKMLSCYSAEFQSDENHKNDHDWGKAQAYLVI
jgi:hypothetical protein